MFKADIDSDLVAEIVGVLVTSWRQKIIDMGIEAQASAIFALSVMEALSQTTRFSLILDFFESHQIEKVRELFKLINSIDELPHQYVEMRRIVMKKFRIE